MSSFLDAVVAVGAREEDELTVVRCVAVFFCIGKQGVSCYDYGCGIRDGAALNRDTTSMRTVKTEKASKSTCSVFLNQSQGWRDFVGVNVCIERCGQKLSRKSGCVSRGIEFAQETSVPGIYRILKDLLHCFEEAVFRLSGLWKTDIHQLCELLGFVMFHKRCARAST